MPTRPAARLLCSGPSDANENTTTAAWLRVCLRCGASVFVVSQSIILPLVRSARPWHRNFQKEYPRLPKSPYFVLTHPRHEGFRRPRSVGPDSVPSCMGGRRLYGALPALRGLGPPSGGGARYERIDARGLTSPRAVRPSPTRTPCRMRRKRARPLADTVGEAIAAPTGRRDDPRMGPGRGLRSV